MWKKCNEAKNLSENATAGPSYHYSACCAATKEIECHEVEFIFPDNLCFYRFAGQSVACEESGIEILNQRDRSNLEHLLLYVNGCESTGYFAKGRQNFFCGAIPRRRE